MKVGDICTRSVFVAWPDESVVQVAQRMRSGHVGDVVVVAGRPDQCLALGIVTDRDIVVAVVAQAAELVAKLTIGDIAQRPLVTVHEDAEHETAIALMRAEAVHRLPVVDDEGRLVGIVSRNDLLEALVEQMRALTVVPDRSAHLERALRG